MCFRVCCCCGTALMCLGMAEGACAWPMLTVPRTAAGLQALSSSGGYLQLPPFDACIAPDRWALLFVIFFATTCSSLKQWHWPEGLVQCRPADWGFDIVVHSATKYLNGHSDLICGVVCASAERIRQVRPAAACSTWCLCGLLVPGARQSLPSQVSVLGGSGLAEGWHPGTAHWRLHPGGALQVTDKLNHLGGCLDPHGCFLLQRGLKTLPLRVRQQNATALALAQFLQSQPQVGPHLGATDAVLRGVRFNPGRCALCQLDIKRACVAIQNHHLTCRSALRS